MTRRAKGWLIASAAFALVNVAGAVMAAIAREPLHAAAHVGFAILGGYIMRWILDSRETLPVAALAVPNDFEDRLTQLEQSLDGLATGVERVGEGQRFINHLFIEPDAARGESDPAHSR